MNPEETTAKLLQSIQAEAEKKWGAKWILNLTRAYCEICRQNGDVDANEHNRRRSIARIFEVNSCTLETAITLSYCVNCRIQLACTREEILVA